jgi:hypothetical protein
MRVALVNAALKGGQARKPQVGLLKGADSTAAAEKCADEVERLREKLTGALGGP